MFIADVARPLVNTNGDMWDRKIGIFPFTETQIAIRNSNNRPTGRS